jgi:undecaprenyl-diphosphatase
MDSLKLFFLALTQGVTELLPVSSSGHLILLGNVIDLELNNVLLTSLHIGTTFAIIFFFRKEILNKFLSKNNRDFFYKILVASIPAILIGVLFEEYIVEELRYPWITALSLILWGVVMVLLNKRENKKSLEIENITYSKSFFIGLTQALALIPGTSRSGITTIFGIWFGLDKYSAFEFSLLLGIPILLGSSLWSLFKEMVLRNDTTSLMSSVNVTNLLIILIVPFVIGYISLNILKRFKKGNWLKTFGIYRIVVGIFIILLQYWP